MAKQQITIMSFILAALLYGCINMGGKDNKDGNNQDEFYTNRGGWDWIRVPLLKPYEVKKIDPEIKINKWGLSFQRIPGATNIKNVAVNDSIIYLQCGDSTLINYKYIKAAWFTIDVRTKTEKGFVSEEEFKTYIKENNYPVPQWHNIDSLSKALGEGSIVPWMPK